MGVLGSTVVSIHLTLVGATFVQTYLMYKPVASIHEAISVRKCDLEVTQVIGIPAATQASWC